MPRPSGTLALNWINFIAEFGNIKPLTGDIDEIAPAGY
jgi:hypothetical protein